MTNIPPKKPDESARVSHAGLFGRKSENTATLEIYAVSEDGVKRNMNDVSDPVKEAKSSADQVIPTKPIKGLKDAMEFLESCHEAGLEQKAAQEQAPKP